MRALLCAWVVLSSLWFPRAAQASLEPSFQSWSMLMVSGRLDPSDRRGAAVWFDLQSRQGGQGTQLLVRPGVGLYLTRRTSLWAGHLVSPTFTADGVRVEQRPWLQLQTVLAPQDSTRLLFRTRFEQRMMEGQSGVALRLRQMARVQQTLKGDVSAVLWDEVFVAASTTPWSAPVGLDANRWFAGLAWLAASRQAAVAEGVEGLPLGARLEGGYLGQVAPRPGGGTLIHALSLNLFLWW